MIEFKAAIEREANQLQDWREREDLLSLVPEVSEALEQWWTYQQKQLLFKGLGKLLKAKGKKQAAEQRQQGLGQEQREALRKALEQVRHDDEREGR